MKEFLKFTLENLNEVSVTAQYYEMIASKNLMQYKEIVHYGSLKEGQTLYTHVMDMIGVTDSLQKIFNLNEIELKVLMTAITIHDINKLEEHEGKSYLSIISQKDKDKQYKNIINECEKMNISVFFNEYKNYIPEIRAIIGHHSEKMHAFSEGLICNVNPFTLDENRVQMLIYWIQAVDKIDLSKTLDEVEKKRQFLSCINAAAQYIGKQYVLEYHRISEDRGILTNICHNTIVQYFIELRYIPIIWYKEGVVYLREDIDEKNKIVNRNEIASRCVESVKSKIYKDYKDYIKNVQSGIKVDEKCLEMTSIEDIIYEIRNRSLKGKLTEVNKRNAKIIPIVEKQKQKHDRDKLEQAKKEIKSLTQKLGQETDSKSERALKKELKSNVSILQEQISAKEALERYEKGTYLIEPNEDMLRFSEFLRGFYTFIKMHIWGNNANKAWDEMYTFLKINEGLKAYLDLFDKVYERPYILGQLLYKEYGDQQEVLIRQMIEYSEKKYTEQQNNKDIKQKNMWDYLKEYIDDQLLLSNERKQTYNKCEILDQYSNKNRKLCCLCSSSYPTEKWMAVDIPYKLKIQNFSNKIYAGEREPKRNICPICKVEYLLHKVTYISNVEVSRKYISILPKSFHTKSYIQAFRTKLREFRQKDIKSLYFNEYKTFVSCANKNIKFIKPLFTKAKVNGVAIPDYDEVIANYFIFPVHFLKDQNNMENWIVSLLYALVMSIYFDSKIILTEFPIAILNKNEMQEIYLEDVPVIFKNLFEKEWTKEECFETAELFTNLFGITKEVVKTGKQGQILEFICKSLIALNNSKLSFIYCVYKKLKSDDKKLISKIIEINDFMDKIMNYVKEDENLVSDIKELAKFAQKYYIRGGINGGNLKDNAINKPLNIIIDSICRWNKDIYTEDDIRAIGKREIQKYFERTNDKYYGKTKIASIETFVDMFIDEIFKKGLKGKVFHLEDEKKNILSAYSYYFRVEMKKEN
ncbi:type I-D CRISPR-associated protein Cas10d/Csc3 [Inediibacterium massiliense]|uniref:type I-D CRISPR-associated protein Cas10d/Csc3 n=1 Tax=Inediibacterium massiliense TaxID=1658111 RepID=UPI0006B5CE33|nr:type I-D CRISPR-associated protein Cas10d/Csc3 [Inediibacterium massiliense]